MNDFIKTGLDFQKQMMNLWTEQMLSFTKKPEEKAENKNESEAENTQNYFFTLFNPFKGFPNAFEAWQKQFMDNDFFKMQTFGQMPFNNQTVSSVFEKLMQSESTYTNLFKLWQNVIGKNPFQSHDEIYKFIDSNKNMYNDLFKSFMTPLLPNTMQPLFEQCSSLMSEYSEIGKNLVHPWIDNSKSLMDNLTKIFNGDNSAFSDYFRIINECYEDTFGRIFNASGIGPSREQTEQVMDSIDLYNKMVISCLELLTLIDEISRENMVNIIETYQNSFKDNSNPQSMKEFYNLFVKMSEDSFVKVFATEQFSKIFCEFSKRACEFKKAFDSVLEKSLDFLPIVKNSEMNSLYKTVYDLRKSEYKNNKRIDELENEIARIYKILEVVNMPEGGK